MLVSGYYVIYVYMLGVGRKEIGKSVEFGEEGK